MDLKAYLNAKRTLVDSFLRSYFRRRFSPPLLREAMLYSLMAGGKRLRPILCLASYEACGKDSKDIIKYASALELIHTYSLIHDDLPSMDNDDLRRGKPTSHKVYGEAIAILAGDGLLTEAFRLLSEESPKIKTQALLKGINEVASGAGIKGMVAGQAQDIISEDATPDGKTLSFIHRHKTGALITSSVRLGAILAAASKSRLDALTHYAKNLGLAFQIVDDILDIKGSTEDLGKPAGSDLRKKKMTYPALYGIEESRKKAERLIEGALGSLRGFPKSADPLREIARYVLIRNN
ncbi:MAG: polyprenyl synthetase family protein [Thermodesulfovibrionales bacterium]|nr:polyprenyl synthetase family protein [Thermodesulfovibrionales bacterium]